MGYKNLALIFIVVFGAFFVYVANAADGYIVNPDGSVKYDDGQVAFGVPIFEATDGIQYVQSDYLGSDLVDYGTYWATPEPSPLSGRFYVDGRIYLGQDPEHYVGMAPIGLFYINYLNPTERELLVSVSTPTLSVINNVATYEQGPVDIVFTNSFSQIKGDIIFPNAPPVPTVSNPALVMVWEIVDYSGINADDGERDEWWFDNAKAAFPIGDIQNNGSATLKKKIFRENGNIYLVEGIGYNWISDANRTDEQFIIDPTVAFNGLDTWGGTSGTMVINPNDGTLENDLSIDYYVRLRDGVLDWNRTTALDGTLIGNAVWDSSGLFLDMDGDYVSFGNPGVLNFTSNFTIYVRYNQTMHYEPAKYHYIFGKDSLFSNGATLVVRENSLNQTIAISRNGATLKQSLWVWLATNEGYNNLTHIFGAYDFSGSGLVRIYKNKDYTNAAGTGTTPNMITPYGWMAGYSSHPLSNDYYWGGEIYEILVIPKYVNQSEVNNTVDNFHKPSQYRQIDNALDAGVNHVHKYWHSEGTDPSDNTSFAIQANVSIDNSSFSWVWINTSCNVGDNVTASEANEYRYLGSPAALFWSNTSSLQETNIISNITIISGPATTPSSTPTATATTPPSEDTGRNSIATNITDFFKGSDSQSILVLNASTWLQYQYDAISGYFQLSKDRPAQFTTFWAVIMILGAVMSLDVISYQLDKNRSKTTIKLNPVLLSIIGVSLIVAGIHYTTGIFSNPQTQIYLWYSVLVLGVIMIIDGGSYNMDKQRTTTILPLNSVLLLLIGTAFIISSLTQTGWLAIT